jgi:hypothetical protein
MRRIVRRERLTGLLALFLCLGYTGAAEAQSAPIEITKVDVLKQKAIDSSQWAALGIRLGDPKDAAMKTLARIASISVQDEAAAGRLLVFSPANSKTMVMSLKIVENQVTTLNLVGAFGDWMQGDTRLLFRTFHDDSLRYRLLGREDARNVAQGGTKEAPSADVSYSYYKEGIILHHSVRQAEGKTTETLREIVLIYPARVR